MERQENPGMEKYEKPSMEIMEVEDSITTSGCPAECPEQCPSLAIETPIRE